MDPFDHILFSAAFSGVGLFMIVLVCSGIWKSAKVRKWPSALGRITESTTFGSYRRFGSGNEWIEEPRISYIYTIGGDNYTGHNIAAVDSNNASKRDAEKKIAPYLVGQEVNVFYNPRNAVTSAFRLKPALGMSRAQQEGGPPAPA